MGINRIVFWVSWSVALFCIGSSCLAEEQEGGLFAGNIKNEMERKHKLRVAARSLALEEITFPGGQKVNARDPSLEDIVRSESRDNQEESYSYLVSAIDSAYRLGKRSNIHVTGLALAYAKELDREEEYAEHLGRWFCLYSSLDPDLVDLLVMSLPVEKWHALFNEVYAVNTNPKSRFKMRSYAFRKSLALDVADSLIATNMLEGLDVSLSVVNDGKELCLCSTIRNISDHDVFIIPHSAVMRVDWVRADGVMLPIPNVIELLGSSLPCDPLFLYPDDELTRERPLRTHLTEDIRRQYCFVWPERPSSGRKSVMFGEVWVAMDDEDAVVRARAVVDPFPEEEIVVLAQALEQHRLREHRYRIIGEPVYSKPILFVSKKGVVSRLAVENKGSSLR